MVWGWDWVGEHLAIQALAAKSAERFLCSCRSVRTEQIGPSCWRRLPRLYIRLNLNSLVPPIILNGPISQASPGALCGSNVVPRA